MEGSVPVRGVLVATDDHQVFVVGTEAAPASWTVPGNGQIQPKAIFATFDGTGAAGSFLPAIKIVSDGGETVGIYPVDTAVAAGASADVSWFPHVGGQLSSSTPGVILQTYAGLLAAADFIFSSAAFVASNYPSNSTFTKISPTSALQIHMNADFTTSATTPDVLFCALFIDGVLNENAGVHVADPNSFITVAWSKIQGLSPTQDPPLSAGAHTLNLRVATNSASATTMRSSSAVDMEIIEYEP